MALRGPEKPLMRFEPEGIQVYAYVGPFSVPRSVPTLDKNLELKKKSRTGMVLAT